MSNMARISCQCIVSFILWFSEDLGCCRDRVDECLYKQGESLYATAVDHGKVYLYLYRISTAAMLHHIDVLIKILNLTSVQYVWHNCSYFLI